MVVRKGQLWSIQPHVAHRRQYFARFVSPHFDEVLNPNVYEPGMRGQMQIAVKKRKQQLLDWYVGNDASKNNPQYFDRILNNCKTYFGEEYGYSGQSSNLISIGEVCFDQPAAPHGPETMLATTKPEQNGGRNRTVTRSANHRSVEVCERCGRRKHRIAQRANSPRRASKSLDQPEPKKAATHKVVAFRKEPPLPWSPSSIKR